MRGKFIVYYRVSTDKQGNSGLELEAQRKAVRDYLDGGNWQLLGEFTEIESGKRSDPISTLCWRRRCPIACCPALAIPQMLPG